MSQVTELPLIPSNSQQFQSWFDDTDPVLSVAFRQSHDRYGEWRRKWLAVQKKCGNQTYMEYLEDLEELDEDLDEPEFEEKPFDPNGKYSKSELVEWADQLLKADAARELCRRCVEDKVKLPYGEETGTVITQPQFDEDGNPVVDDTGRQLVLDFAELACENGHKWLPGDGVRRDIRGDNPILFETHLKNRQRREIYVEAGIPDPAFTTDRFGRPTQGMYNRVHPQGRKVNTKEQRTKNGAGFYR